MKILPPYFDLIYRKKNQIFSEIWKIFGHISTKIYNPYFEKNAGSHIMSRNVFTIFRKKSPFLYFEKNTFTIFRKKYVP